MNKTKLTLEYGFDVLFLDKVEISNDMSYHNHKRPVTKFGD